MRVEEMRIQKTMRILNKFETILDPNPPNLLDMDKGLDFLDPMGLWIHIKIYESMSGSRPSPNSSRVHPYTLAIKRITPINILGNHNLLGITITL